MTEEAYLSNNDIAFEQNLASFKENLNRYSQDINPDNKQYQNDKLAFSAQRAILSSLLILLPDVVNRVREKPTQGTVYALTNLIDQVNELFGQLRSSEALEEQVEFIQDSIINLMLKELITFIFDKVYYAKQSLKQDSFFMDNPKALEKVFNSFDMILKDIAPEVNKKQDETKEKLQQYLLEV